MRSIQLLRFVNYDSALTYLQSVTVSSAFIGYGRHFAARRASAKFNHIATVVCRNIIDPRRIAIDNHFLYFRAIGRQLRFPSGRRR
jgi:hypothetical protein